MRWLDDNVASLKAANEWLYFQIKAGPVCFCVALTTDSSYRAALDAFFYVSPIAAPAENQPLVFVTDTLPLLDQCYRTHAVELSDLQAAAKLSNCRFVLNWDPVRGLLKYFNTATGLGLFAARDLGLLPSWEWFSPMKEFVHLWALERNAWLAHAAAVGVSENDGMLLVGPGGSGKSTTCARLIQIGYKTCGDDYVLLSKMADQVYAHAIYCTLKLMPKRDLVDQRQGLSILKSSSVAETGKLVYFLKNVDRGTSLIHGMVLKKIYGLQLVDNLTDSIRLGDLGYSYYAMSSFGQIPVWLDRSMAISKNIYETLPKALIDVRRNISGLNRLIAFL